MINQQIFLLVMLCGLLTACGHGQQKKSSMTFNEAIPYINDPYNNCNHEMEADRSKYCDYAAGIYNDRVNQILDKDKVMVALIKKAINQSVNCGNSSGSEGENNPYCRAIIIRLNQIGESQVQWWDIFDTYNNRLNVIAERKNQQTINTEANKLLREASESDSN